jgi:nicotinamidase/pyrazinamidase
MSVSMDLPGFERGDGLLIVDPQNDFCPGGTLGVAEGDQVMPVLSAWATAASEAGCPVIVSRDWHPARTTHFQAFGGVWPAHCVQGTRGAAFHADLRLPAAAVVVSKGMGETEDAYSAFQARTDEGVPLADLLAARAVRHLYVMGLATDYCVKASALGGLERGLRVSVVQSGCRAVDLQPGDGHAALAAIETAGGVLRA